MAPTQPAMVIRRHPETAERRLDVLRWGLVPHFTNDLKACKRPINTRSEKAGTFGMFRGALASRRCLVPVAAFYDWRVMADGKQPYAIARVDGAPIALAGLWEGWRDTAGETFRTFTILATAANDAMSWLHDRMQVILEAADWPVWLSGAAAITPRVCDQPRVDWCGSGPSAGQSTACGQWGELLDCVDDPAAPAPSDAPA